MSPRALALLKGVFVRTLHLGIGITTVMLTLTLFRYDFNAPHSHVGLVYLTTGALAMAVAIVGAIDLCWDVLNTYVVTTTDTINLILFGTNIVILTVAHSAISCPGDDSSYADGRCQLASGLFWIQLAGSVTSLIIRYTHRKLKSVVHYFPRNAQRFQNMVVSLLCDELCVLYCAGTALISTIPCE